MVLGRRDSLGEGQGNQGGPQEWVCRGTMGTVAAGLAPPVGPMPI